MPAATVLALILAAHCPPGLSAVQLRLGPVVPLWVSLALADWLVKLLIALAALIPFRIIVAKLTARVA